MKQSKKKIKVINKKSKLLNAEFEITISTEEEKERVDNAIENAMLNEGGR